MASFDSPGNMWWLRKQPVQDSLPAIQLGVQMARQQQLDALNAKNTELQAVRTQLQVEKYFYDKELQNQLVAGNAELAKAIATNFASGFTADSPEFQAAIWGVANKYPTVMRGDTWKGITELGPDAEAARTKADYWREQIALRDRQVGLQERLAEDSGWVQPEGDAPGYFLDAKGNAKYPPRRLSDGTNFQPKETTVGTTRLVQVSPNKWQVVDRAIPTGKITDIEREQLRDMRSQLAALMSSFGEQKDIDALKTKIDAVYAKVQGREESKALPLKTDLKQPITKAEYDKLPKGAEYVDPDGVTRIKQ